MLSSKVPFSTLLDHRTWRTNERGKSSGSHDDKRRSGRRSCDGATLTDRFINLIFHGVVTVIFPWSRVGPTIPFHPPTTPIHYPSVDSANSFLLAVSVTANAFQIKAFTYICIHCIIPLDEKGREGEGGDSLPSQE